MLSPTFPQLFQDFDPTHRSGTGASPGCKSTALGYLTETIDLTNYTTTNYKYRAKIFYEMEISDINCTSPVLRALTRFSRNCGFYPQVIHLEYVQFSVTLRALLYPVATATFIDTSARKSAVDTPAPGLFLPHPLRDPELYATAVQPYPQRGRKDRQKFPASLLWFVGQPPSPDWQRAPAIIASPGGEGVSCSRRRLRFHHHHHRSVASG